MTQPNDLITELRRTVEQMQALGDLNKADLLTRAADYIEEKRLQEEADDKFTDDIQKGSVVWWVCRTLAQGWHISKMEAGSRYFDGNGKECIYLYDIPSSGTTHGVPVSFIGKSVFAREKDAILCLKQKLRHTKKVRPNGR